MDGRAKATMTMRMDGRAEATTTTTMYGRVKATMTTMDGLAKATTTRMVGAGNDDEEDGQEVANEADYGQKNITINLWVNW